MARIEWCRIGLACQSLSPGAKCRSVSQPAPAPSHRHRHTLGMQMAAGTTHNSASRSWAPSNHIATPLCRPPTDDMDYGATTVFPVESFQIMHDAEMMEGCGFADLGQIVNSVGRPHPATLTPPQVHERMDRVGDWPDLAPTHALPAPAVSRSSSSGHTRASAACRTSRQPARALAAPARRKDVSAGQPRSLPSAGELLDMLCVLPCRTGDCYACFAPCMVALECACCAF